ncbi:MAG TPA: metallophosphoesterase family protein [Devosiaceae bacterium]
MSILKTMRSLLGQQATTPASQRQRLVLDPLQRTIYAVGDIHGCLELLRVLERRIVARSHHDEGASVIVMLGDYVDRGPHSAGVLDHLLAPPPEGFSRLCLAGNHEQMMLDALSDRDAMALWLGNGGLETLRSYGVPDAVIRHLSPHDRHVFDIVRSYVPNEHIEFLSGLPAAVQAGEYLLVHAAIDPARDLSELSDEALLWARFETDGEAGTQGPLVVHGHTVKRETAIVANRLCLDTGAFATGVLSAARLGADGSVEILTTAGERPELLRPATAKH